MRLRRIADRHNMPVEKHGGFWLDSPRDGQLVFELYDDRRDLLGIVFRRADGLLKSVLFEKVADPQWTLPVWSERRPEALFDREDDAQKHISRSLEMA